MPSKNTIRNYYQNGYYHIYNRGVEKRLIFLDTQDYQIFLYYLFIYTSPLEKVLIKYPDLPFRLYSKNLSQELSLICYCLMPNHFHLLLNQSTKDGITKLIKQLTNAYTQYFNHKYSRVGSLMQGKYKSVDITSDEQLLHLSRYIHLNPVIGDLALALQNYKWSSFSEYQGQPKICKTSYVLDHFSSSDAYLSFCEDQIDYARKLDPLKYLTIDQGSDP